jgi:hypothetical protein
MFTKEVMGVQLGESPNFKNFKIPDMGVLGKTSFGCNPHDESQRIL